MTKREREWLEIKAAVARGDWGYGRAKHGVKQRTARKKKPTTEIKPNWEG